MKVRQLMGLLLLITFLFATTPVAALPPLDLPLPTTAAMASVAAADGVQFELAGWTGGRTRAVAVHGAYAYAAVGAGLVILDVSEPAHPIVVGQSIHLPYTALDLAVAGNYVYMA